jgi:hypothetical protein
MTDPFFNLTSPLYKTAAREPKAKTAVATMYSKTAVRLTIGFDIINILWQKVIGNHARDYIDEHLTWTRNRFSTTNLYVQLLSFHIEPKDIPAAYLTIQHLILEHYPILSHYTL